MHPISNKPLALFFFNVLNKKFLKKLIALSDKNDSEVRFAYLLSYNSSGDMKFDNCKWPQFLHMLRP